MNGLGTRPGGAGAAGRKDRNRRVTAFALSLAMIFNLFPAQAIAEALETEPKEQAPVEQPAEEVNVEQQAEEAVAAETPAEPAEEVVEEETPLQPQAEVEEQAELPLVDQAIAATDEASIGSTGYATLDAAIAAASSGQTIVLQNNISRAQLDPAFTIAAGKSVTLELNGKEIRSAITSAPIITNNGTLTITGSGRVYSENGSSFPIIQNNSGATLNVQGGDYGDGEKITQNVVRNAGTANLTGGSFNSATTSGFVLYNEANATMSLGGGVKVASLGVGMLQNAGGTVNISAGTFEGTNTNQFVYAQGGKVNVTGGTFRVALGAQAYSALFVASGATASDVYITVSGGSFVCSNIADPEARGIAVSGGNFDQPIGAAIIADGYRLTSSGVQTHPYTVGDASKLVAGLELSSGVITYYTLGEALQKVSASDGALDTIVLAGNTSESVTVSSDVTIKTTVDTVKSYSSTVVRNAYTLSGAVAVDGKATLTLGGDVTVTGDVNVLAGATLEVGLAGNTTQNTKQQPDYDTEGDVATVAGNITLHEDATLHVAAGEEKIPASKAAGNGKVTGGVSTASDIDFPTFTILNEGTITGQITANSGIININQDKSGSNLYISKGRFDHAPLIAGDEDTHVYVYGGLFKESLALEVNVCAPGYMPADYQSSTDLYQHTVKEGIAATVEQNGRVVTSAGTTHGYFADLSEAVKAVKTGQTVKLQDSAVVVSLTSAAASRTYTLDLNGYSVLGENDAITVVKDAVTIIDSKGGAVVSGSTTALVVGAGGDDGSKLTVRGGTFVGSSVVDVKEKASLTIPADSEAEFIGTFARDNNAKAVSVKGGFFYNMPGVDTTGSLGSAGFLEDTDWVKAAVDHVSKAKDYEDYAGWLTIGQVVAKKVDDSARYATLQEAINANRDGEEIVILTNIDEQDVRVPAGAELTIDLNGSRLTKTLTTLGALTVKNSASKQTPKTPNVAGVTIGNGGVLTIAAKNDGLRNVVVDSVTADPGANKLATLENASIVNKVEALSGLLVINKLPASATGLFANQNPEAKNDAAIETYGGLYTAIVADKYLGIDIKPVSSTTVMPALESAITKVYPFTVKEMEKPVALYEGLYYETLQDAVAALEAAGSTGTITVVGNSDTKATIGNTEGRRSVEAIAVTIDLAGVDYEGQIEVGNANVILKDSVGTGKLVASTNKPALVVYGDKADAERYGSLTIEGSATVEAAPKTVAISFAGTNSYGFDVIVNGTVNGQVVVDQNSADKDTRNPSTLTIADGGTVTAVAGIGDAIKMDGYVATVVADGGEVASREGSGIAMTTGALYVHGGSIYGAASGAKAGIEFKNTAGKDSRLFVDGGEIAGVNGLTITGNDEGSLHAVGLHGGNFVARGGKALNATDSVVAILPTINVDDVVVADNKGTGIVYGGFFNTKLENAAAAKGYVPYLYDESNGIWSVQSGTNVATVKDPVDNTLTYYTTLQAAIDAASEDGRGAQVTVTLIEDVLNEAVQVKSGSVALNLNAHNLRSTANTLKIEKDATLVLSDKANTDATLSTTSTTGSAIVNDGTLAINGVTVTGGEHTVTNSGKLTFNQGAGLTTLIANASKNGIVLWSASEDALATINAGTFDAQGVFGKVFEGTSGSIAVKNGYFSNDFSSTTDRPENVTLTVTTGYAPIANKSKTGTADAYVIGTSLKAYDFKLTVPYVAAKYDDSDVATLDNFAVFDTWTGKELSTVGKKTVKNVKPSGVDSASAFSDYIKFKATSFSPKASDDNLTPSLVDGKPQEAGVYTRSLAFKDTSPFDDAQLHDATLVIEPYDISEPSTLTNNAYVKTKRVDTTTKAEVAYDPYAEAGTTLSVGTLAAAPAGAAVPFMFKSGVTAAATSADVSVYLKERFDRSTSTQKSVANVTGVYVANPEIDYANNTTKNENASVKLVGQGSFTGERVVSFKVVGASFTNTNKSKNHIAMGLDLSSKGGQPKPVVWYVKDALSANISGTPVTVDKLADLGEHKVLVEDVDYSLG